MLLRPRPPSTAVDEGERACVAGTGPGIRLRMQPLWPHRATTKGRPEQCVCVALAISVRRDT
jgi:hypothetical protein